MSKHFIVYAVLAAAFSAALPVQAADGPGVCGEGKVWDGDQKKCVPKPTKKGSHAG